MDVVSITDEQNNKYRFKRYNGYPFIVEAIGNVGDQLRKIANMKCRPDDVLVDVFPKSGTHWLYNTVRMLKSGSLKYTGTPTFMEFQDHSIISEMESPRTFAAHMRFRFIPEEMKRGTGKVVTITRNPKDIVVSLYRMLQSMGDIGYQGNFEGLMKLIFSEECFFGNGSWGAWIKDMEDWTTPNLIVLSYEDFKMDTFTNVVKLAKFLEVDHSEEFLRDVVQSIQFDKLKQSHIDTAPITDRWKDITAGGKVPIYRKGQIGEWKSTFTVAQNEWFEQAYKENAAEYGVKITFKYQ